MKKVLSILVLLVCGGCAAPFKLKVANDSSEMSKSSKSVYIDMQKGDIYAARLKKDVAQILKDNGWRVVADKSSAQNVASFYIEEKSWQTTTMNSTPMYAQSVPVYSGGSTFSASYAMPTYNTVTNFSTCFYLTINKLKNQAISDQVYNSSFCADYAVDKTEFSSYVKDVYGKHFNEADIELSFKCESSGPEYGACYDSSGNGAF